MTRYCQNPPVVQANAASILTSLAHRADGLPSAGGRLRVRGRVGILRFGIRERQTHKMDQGHNNSNYRRKASHEMILVLLMDLEA
jgi:hypothetical protein